jgi:iron complex transport system substrate-binding protein
MSRRMLAAFAVLALMAASCGDDDAQPTTQAPPPATEAPEPTLPGAPEGRTVVGADGVESVVADTSRIVSLNGDITEIIYELGLGDRLVAVDVTTTFPPESDELPRIGFAQQLAAEPVLAFAPTVVIGDQQIQPADSIEQLRTAGVPVVIIETQTTLDGIETKILAVAEALDADAAGRELADRVNSEIAEATALAAQAQQRARVAFLYSRGPQQIFLFGSGTVTQALIEGANAVDTISESGLPAVVPLTPEALVAAAPDVIIVPASGVGALGGMEAVAALPGVGETPAGRDGAFLV